MAFSLGSIKAMAGSSILEQAQKMKKQGVVKIISCQSFWKEEVTVKGTITEDGIVYQSSFTLREGQYKKMSCSCGKESFCTHVAALSLSYIEKNSQKWQPSAVTSQIMKNVIEQYASKEIKQVMMEKEKGEAVLMPTVLVGTNGLKLTFRIGNKTKSYILKDIIEFYRLMKAGSTKEYGKNFSLPHVLWSFEQGNRSLVEFVLEQAEEALDYYAEYNPHRTQSGIKTRELVLNKRNLDSFFSLWAGKRLEVEDRYGRKSTAEVFTEEPELPVTIQELEEDSYEVDLDEEVMSFEGRRSLVIYTKQNFYICGEAYKEDMGAFLTEFQNRRNTLTISRRDMPGFCGQCVPFIRKHTRLETAFNLEEYMPRPVEAEFSFDSMEDGTIITCEEKLIYGDFSFNPIKGVNVPVGIYRDYTGEYRIRSVVEHYFHYVDDRTGRLIMSEEDSVFRLLEEGIQEFMMLGKVYISEDLKQVRIVKPKQVAAGINLDGNLLELTVDTEGIEEEELMKILESYRIRKRYYRLRSGEFMRIEDTAFGALSELADGLSLTAKELKEGRISIPPYRAMYVEQVLSENGQISITRNRQFRALIKELRNANDNEYDVPKSLVNILREYQKTGYRWMRTLEKYGFGGILADDMGLGKTIQVLAMFLDRIQELEHAPALIVCPASLIYNWENEIKRFAPELEAVVIAGSAMEREDKMRRRDARVWITSYDLLKRDIDKYQKFFFTYEIIDEAQMIKNHMTQGAKAVKSIHAGTRFALTGTPIENRLSELWSIFDYLMPGFLFSYQQFREELEIRIVKEQDEMARRKLKRMVGPFVLRRLKKEVLKELPDKLEQVVYARMEGEQRNLYMATAARLSRQLREKTEKEYQMSRFQVLAELTRLRQICCDPALCFDDYGAGSIKLETCMELVEEGLAGGHKLLIFSQFTSMLEIIGKRLREKQIAYYEITGQVPKQKRVELVDQFNAGDTGVFLISLKAGGTGLNLTGADIVIHYDPWWNSAAQNQATDRAHRIGQKNVVTVFKLIVKDTIEEGILSLQESKKELSNQIIGSEEMGFGALALQDVISLLQE